MLLLLGSRPSYAAYHLSLNLDKLLKKFNVTNNGTLNVTDILIKIDYTVNDLK